MGVNCAYNTVATGGGPITTQDGNMTLNTLCQWAGDVDGDGAVDPLVSDNPSLSTAGSGGGITVDIIITNLNTSINGFDQIISYDTHVLDAVLVDQTGLTFGGNVGCGSNPSCTLTTALTIDHNLGRVRVAQALLGITIGPGGTCNTGTNPSCTSPNQTLFRIRFDVVGAGTGFINFSSDPTQNVIVNPSSVRHTSQNSGLSTNSLFAMNNRVSSFTNGYNASWTFSPNPEVPGNPLTFTATASCGSCTSPFTYNWDFSSLDSPSYVGKVDATGATVTFSPPLPVMNRVTLTVSDSAAPAHTVNATRRLPLATAVTGPATVAQGTPSAAFNGKWLGGVVTTTAGYSGQWKFCPGSASVKTVCSTPLSAFSQNPPSINETSRVASVTYNFGGVYTESLSISDTAVTQISANPNTAIGTTLINVTGATPAYTVNITPTPTVQLQSLSISFAMSVHYTTSYPSNFRSNTFTYQLAFGDGNTSPPQSAGATFTISHLYGSTGAFNVKVIATETAANAPTRIMETNTTSVNVVLPITGDFTFSPSSPTSGQSVSFTATASGGSGTYTYSWSFGDGVNGTGNSSTHSYTAGTYNVTLKITDSFGSIFTVSHSITVASQGVSPLIIGGGIAAAIAIVAGLLLFLRRRRGVAKSPPPPAGPSVRR